jgi:transposase-like protein
VLNEWRTDDEQAEEPGGTVRSGYFDSAVINLCFRWHLRYKLSLRDLVEITTEWGLSLAHSTILRWVRRYTPHFVKRRKRFGTSTGRSWRVDKTDLKIRGSRAYLYRAVDPAGQTVGLMLRAKRALRQPKPFSGKPSNIRANHR